MNDGDFEEDVIPTSGIWKRLGREKVGKDRSDSAPKKKGIGDGMKTGSGREESW